MTPRAILEQVAKALPQSCRANVIVIGRLAAGYRFFDGTPRLQVRTKDVDCLLAPRVAAIAAAQAVTEELFSANWSLRTDGAWGSPGDANTPLSALPVVRLHPPSSRQWFIELLTVPESEDDTGRKDVRLATSRGHFSLCSFGFLSLAEFKPIETPLGIAIARPEMMALANLLHHPSLGTQTMSGLIEGRTIKRSSRDLGRVIALASLDESRQEDSLLEWPTQWAKALQTRFPSGWRGLAQRAGSGLRELLEPEHEQALEEARHTCEFGLLASRPLSVKQMRATAERLIQDAIAPLERLAGETS